MNRIYIICFVMLVVLGAYAVGGRVAHERCRADATVAMVAEQEKLIKLKEDVNAEVFNRGVDDIRRVLRKRYTIAE